MIKSQLKLALVQSPLIWENPKKNREMFLGKIAALQSDVDLIVLPEMFTTGFTMQPESIAVAEGMKTLEWMQTLAQKKQAAITGSMVFKEDTNFFNRLFFVYPDGTYKTYDKRHTFTLAGEDKVYQAGEEQLLVHFKDFIICPLICYDLRFPVWARNTKNYDMLLFVANWPKPRIQAWDALLKARAIENLAYSVGVNRIGTDSEGHKYPGHSAVYDVLGNTVVFSKREEVLYATLHREHIQSYREKLRFLEDRDEFILQ